MKSTTMFLVGTIFWLLAGCSSMSATDTASTLAQAKLADMLIQTGVVDDVVFEVNLSDDEINTYIESLEVYKSFREQWKNPTADMYVLLDAQYHTLYRAYKNVEAVVVKHWAEYPPATQARLQTYQNYATKINNGVAEALKAKSEQEALNNAIQLGLIIAQIAAAS